MKQNAHSLTGGSGSPEIPRILTAAPGTLRLRIMQKNEPNVESTCLPPGGMINAHGPGTTHVEFVGPEPGVGYGGYRKSKGQVAMKDGFARIVPTAACSEWESGEISCT